MGVFGTLSPVVAALREPGVDELVEGAVGGYGVVPQLLHRGGARAAPQREPFLDVLALVSLPRA